MRLKRDPKRIPDFMHYLRLLWERCPDLRFNQLVDFIKSQYNDNHDMFYVEDEVFLAWVKEELSKIDTQYYEGKSS